MLHSGKKYFTLLSLYLAQSIPMSFFSTVVPVIMRQENYSLESIGYIQLVKLPWILKFLWAPLVDKKCRSRHDYRRWVLASEIFYAVVILSIGFFDLQAHFPLIVALMVVAFVASATQDIATDAFAVLSLHRSERSVGNSMQSGGNFLGTLFGSGVLLIIYHYFGWQLLLVALAGFVLVALLPLSFTPLQRTETQTHSSKAIGLKDIGLFFRQKGILRRVFLLTIYYSGIIGILTMLKPFLVDLGYNVKQIGFISGIFGTATGTVCALGAGFLLKKVGNKTGIVAFSFFNLLAAVYFLWLSFGSLSEPLIYAGVALLWGAYGMSSVVIYTISMNVVRPGREGTDFTIQIVITHLSSLIMAVLSGKIAQHFEYQGLFALEALLALGVILAVSALFRENCGRQ